MNRHKEIPFLDEKLKILHAAEVFEKQLTKVMAKFDYLKEIKINGLKPLGQLVFYEKSEKLIRWIEQDQFFKRAKVYRSLMDIKDRHNSEPQSLSSAFVNLQATANHLLDILLNNVNELQEQRDKKHRFKVATVNKLVSYRFGIAILQTIIIAKPEEYWIKMFEEGYKNSHLLSSYK